ncbi:Uncharacterised protein [uncultured archaeon]|nr:Uncharacterised protein [uncultured archaeon]
MIKRSDKRAIEMGFNWIFSIIAGGFILFIAIYASTKFIGVSQQQYGTEAAATISTFLDSLETGLSAGIKNPEMTFNKNTRLYFDCDEVVNSPFGRQTISFSEQTFGNRWSDQSNRVSIKNKYIFSENAIEGKKFYYFSFPLSMPYSVGDVVVIESGKYCFYDAPTQIIDDISTGGIDVANIIFPNATSDCVGTKVCFGGSRECDIKVSISENYVEKDGKRMYYYGNMIYGAIFSSPEIYECNSKRMMSKLNELGKIYLDKIKIMERKDCEPRLGDKLNTMIGVAKNLTSSRELIRLGNNAEEIDQINEAGKPGCKVY